MTDRIDTRDEKVYTVTWPDIAREFAYNRLCFVSSQVELSEVADAMADDDAPKIRRLMQDDHFRLSNDEDAAKWSQNPELTFNLMIVSPFVLVQPQEH